MSAEMEWPGEAEINDLVSRFEAMMQEDAQSFFDVDEFESIIDYYFDIHEFGMSNKAVDLGLEQHPSCTSFKIRKSRLLAYEKKFYEALEILNLIQLIEPANEEIFIIKGEIYSLMNKHELAIAEYQNAIPLSENPEEIYANIAFEYENLNDYPNAIKNLKAALNEKPESENLIHEIAFFFEITGREEEAILFFQEFLDDNPYSKVAWFNLGIFFNALDFFEKAVEAYEFALAIDENFSSAIFNLANAYSGLKMYRKAIHYYKETFKFEDAEAITYNYIAESYESLEDLKEAMVYFNKALEVDEKLADAWAGLGRVFVKQDLDKTAVQYYEKAIEFMPLNDDFKYELAITCLRNKWLKKAQMLFDEIVNHDPQYIEAWINKSICVSLTEGLDAAIDVIESALLKNKESASLWYRLAGYLYNSGKVQQAFYYVEAAMKLDFDKNVELLEMIPSLEQESRFIELLSIYKSAE